VSKKNVKEIKVEKLINGKVTRGVVLAAIIATGALFAACSTGSGSSDDVAATTNTETPATTPATTPANPATPSTTTDPTTPASPATPAAPGQKDDTVTPTLIDITGSWKSIFLYSDEDQTYNETDTTTITINSDGTYLRYVTEEYVMTPTCPYKFKDNCFAERGKVTVAADGTVTFKTEETGTNETQIITDLSKLAWGSDKYEKFSYAAKAGGKLYLYTFHRNGTGTGIKGTWISINNDGEGDTKDELIIGDTTVTMNHSFYDNMLSEWKLDPKRKDTYDKYVIENGKIKLYDSGDLMEDYALTYTDEFLALDSGFVRI